MCCSLIVQRLSGQRDTVIIYKKIDTTELKLWIHYPKKVKNILALSGYINEDILPDTIEESNVSHLNFFCSHGTVLEIN